VTDTNALHPDNSISRRTRVALFIPISFEGRLVGEGIWRVLKELVVANAKRDDAALDVTIVGPAWIREELEDELRLCLGDRMDRITLYVPAVQLAIVGALWRSHRRAKERLSKRQQRRMRGAERKLEVRGMIAKVLGNRAASLFAGVLLPWVSLVYAWKYWWQDRERKESLLVRLLVGRAVAGILEGEFASIIRNYQKKEAPDVWWVPYPIALGSTALEGPRVVHVYDLAYADFPKGQDLGSVATSKVDIAVNVRAATEIITHSEHVRDRVAVPLFDIPREKISVLPHASPDLRPFVTHSDSGQLWSRAEMADRIRAYCTSKRMNWPTVDDFIEEIVAPRLGSFPFDNAPYILLSTQNRSYKNVLQVAKAIRVLNHQRGYRVHLALTGQFKPSDKTDALARYAINNHLMEYLLPLPRVPDDVLAALYGCAAVAIHPSLYEGGVGAFPFYEALSVDCPALVSVNDSMREALLTEPGYSVCLFNPYNTTDLVNRIEVILKDREAAVALQRPVHSRVSNKTWSDLLDEYTPVFERAARSVKDTP
jgi:glycosyltransferase involved in cell wall biosynthesis